ncbi:hypothetical protein PLICRDRAFT_52341 [Plicaturopsis crispa FD-325 SS-3]|nr:hypothetical protein PLICRDRAFT_52341 [Plicaturopsis crispa FD-325 SS-3]
MRAEEGFQPVPFVEGNAFTADPVLPSLLKRLLPSSIRSEIEPDLEKFGNEVVTSIRALADRAEPPKLVQYNQWGARIDGLQTSEGWRNLKAIAQREGIPGIAYERKYGEYSRVYSFAKAVLLEGDCQTTLCPISMTDGCARVLELLGTSEMKRHILPRLISRDPTIAFTSGQWMTERPGGSDVSQTETTAASVNLNNNFGPQYTLDGFKWFSSATDSDVSLALARTGSAQDGSRGLSLFLVPLRRPLLRSPSDPTPPSISNGIFVHRLKNKIGTHALPTAELSLSGTEAYLIGALNNGVKSITPVLNITRVYAATSSIGNLRKCLAIATAYANVRSIRGGQQLLRDTPLHVAQLASVNLVYRALTHLTFGVVLLLGKSECGVASTEEQHRLRMLTPIVKAFTSEKACPAMEEAMTLLGGQGYMEENGIGRSIRDGLVEKIWEGTTTVLSLDLVRAVRDPATIKAFLAWGRGIVASCPEELQNKNGDALQALRGGLDDITTVFAAPMPALLPRPAIMLVSYVASSLYLLEHAVWSYTNGELERAMDVEVFRRWVMEGGFAEAVADVKRSRASEESERLVANSEIVYGSSARAKL